ncbi:MAG: hypothetical protein RMJ97_07095 [Raineya sp.]|nr:hypothetical protein [Raineya sp.]
MKTLIKSILLVVMLLGYGWELEAQLPKRRWLPQRSYQEPRPYWAMQLSLGAKQLLMTPTLFALNYDHPDSDTLFLNQENIITGTFKGGSSIAFNANFAVEAGFTKGFFGELRFDGIFTNPFLTSIEVGGGWNFELTYYENERLLTIRPVVDMVWLFNQFKVGSYNFPENVRQIALLDEIYERRATLNFYLRNQATCIKPRLSISLPISPGWMLRADVGYLFVLNKRSRLRITQENIHESPYVLSPDEERLGFTMNGIRSRTDLFTYSGFVYNIGIARKFGDNRDNGRRYKGRYAKY